MENNLIKIFEDTIISNHDNGNTINSLIKLNIIDIDDLIEEIIDTYNPEYIYNLTDHGKKDERLCLERDQDKWSH